MLTRCREHAGAIGLVELDRLARLMLANGADRQRSWAREHGLAAVVPSLIKRYATPKVRPRRTAQPVQRYEGAFR